MKKLIIVTVIALMITTIFYGVINIIISEGSLGNTRFEKVKNERQYFDGYWFYVIYDKETKVEYAFSGKGGLQVLVDKEGKPLIYKESEEK